MAKVEIYTKASCGFCFQAKRLLDMKGVDYLEYPIDSGGPKREEMIRRAGGRTTVPQIFVDGRHIGGCDDIMALEYQGRLDELIAA